MKFAERGLCLRDTVLTHNVRNRKLSHLCLWLKLLNPVLVYNLESATPICLALAAPWHRAGKKKSGILEIPSKGNCAGVLSPCPWFWHPPVHTDTHRAATSSTHFHNAAHNHVKQVSVRVGARILFYGKQESWRSNWTPVWERFFCCFTRRITV